MSTHMNCSGAHCQHCALAPPRPQSEVIDLTLDSDADVPQASSTHHSARRPSARTPGTEPRPATNPANPPFLSPAPVQPQPPDLRLSAKPAWPTQPTPPAAPTQSQPAQSQPSQIPRTNPRRA